jgi:hypothetical protein
MLSYPHPKLYSLEKSLSQRKKKQLTGRSSELKRDYLAEEREQEKFGMKSLKIGFPGTEPEVSRKFKRSTSGCYQLRPVTRELILSQ